MIPPHLREQIEKLAEESIRETYPNKGPCLVPHKSAATKDSFLLTCHENDFCLCNMRETFLAGATALHDLLAKEVLEPEINWAAFDKAWADWPEAKVGFKDPHFHAAWGTRWQFDQDKARIGFYQNSAHRCALDFDKLNAKLAVQDRDSWKTSFTTLQESANARIAELEAKLSSAEQNARESEFRLEATAELEAKLAEAEERAEHWEKQYTEYQRRVLGG